MIVLGNPFDEKKATPEMILMIRMWLVVTLGVGCRRLQLNFDWMAELGQWMIAGLD